jgi:hypothetical protein
MTSNIQTPTSITPSSRQGTWLREELRHLLSLSGTLAGFALPVWRYSSR